MEKKSKFKLIIELFLVFFKIGAFTFGGGYAMIPIIQREVSEKKKWIKDSDILDIVAIAESTPGPIAINTSTFVGFKTAGFWGAVFATFGAVLPSFIIITLISFVLRNFSSYRPVRYAFYGIRAGVIALIIKSFVSMLKQLPKSAAAYILMAAAFVLAVFTEINVIYIIIGCGVLGLISSMILGRSVSK